MTKINYFGKPSNWTFLFTDFRVCLFIYNPTYQKKKKNTVI